MIAIVCAMHLELDEILKISQNIQELSISNHTFYQVSLADQEAVICLSGVGKVNAACSTTLLLEYFPIEALINIGTAGGLRENQAVLDMVISDQVVQYDYDTSALDGNEGLGIYANAAGPLIELSKQVATDLNIQYHQGLIASGDQFVANDEQINNILTKFEKSVCVEMEAGAIASVASLYETPFIVLRSLSDIAVKKENHMDFQSYAKVASERSALFCMKFMERYGR